MTELDHIVVIAPDLGEGVAWVRETLGVEMTAGGKHPEMGTHNRLVGLGPNVYLEVIAVDPEAPSPLHRRWFGLDDREDVEQYWREGRRLRAYVARCTDIVATIGESGWYGTPMRVSRGDREWLFAGGPDGELPRDGLLPCLIDWGARGTPAPTMPDLGLRLERFVVETPGAHTLLAGLNALGVPPFEFSVRRGPAWRLTASIATPQGVRVLN